MSQKYAHFDADYFVIGFYDDEIHGDAIPERAVKISDETYAALLDGQASGKRMKVTADGSPELVDHPPPPDDVLAAQVRAQRNAALAETDWTVAQQQEHILNGTTPDNPERFKAYATYRQALRDVPQQVGFPREIDWPAKPQ
ncbi:tail fiber assembly protein [Paraburkholderia sp. HD33-4]|uniref:tail fiber assembly protein n=1 Tax=Paraburkholderia sp. HD33-4 TaxID=2883242 RepID=UPI001F36D83C|nr:tail fiber assembly protein [Paraburkholderia sp. HD33-4]